MFFNLINNNYLILLSFIFSFLVSNFLINYIIKYFKKKNKFQPIREEGIQEHFKKAGTPTMGGVGFFLSAFINILLWCDLSFYFVWIFLFCAIGFGFIGLIDDYMKVFLNNTKGFKGGFKLILELIVGSATILALSYYNGYYLSESFRMPIMNIWLNLGIFAFPFIILSMAGSANAVNITDGLDGLLSIPVLIILSLFFIVIYFNPQFNVIKLNFNEKEILNFLIIITSMIGSLLVFFKFNKRPAKIFMGDVGSLFLGSSLFLLAYIMKIELFYAIMAMLFIIEISSTTIQVISYKLFQKRVFKMAPIHHHFEKCGYSEGVVTTYLWLFSLIFSSVGFILLFF